MKKFVLIGVFCALLITTVVFAWPEKFQSNEVLSSEKLNKHFTELQNRIEELEKQMVPKGTIVAWFPTPGNNNPPSGWQICNGAMGTPDLKDRFIVGAGSSYQTGDKGGLSSIVLNEKNLPPHTHTINNIYNAQHVNDAFWTTGDVHKGMGVSLEPATTVSKGEGTAIENRPPFFALIYIIKI